jgi:hypothetical protein
MEKSKTRKILPWGIENAVFFNTLAAMGKKRNTVYKDVLKFLRRPVRRTDMSASL